MERVQIDVPRIGRHRTAPPGGTVSLPNRHVARDGWPRISPVEPYLVDGDLMMGMMTGSRKAADLLRDPRLVVHSIVTRWEADERDVKLYGTAEPVTEPEPRNALFQAMTEAHSWSGPPSMAEDPAYHVYRMAVDRAAYVRFDGSSRCRGRSESR